ncbi:MAG: DUF3179 domain-containing protein [Alphaproteobacteria bacterium]|nr:DUF3179 domain-containing protein [Alphaproteobacteria bacterium]MBT4019902.1 DUF3179 domain-containing protein [Alphaproteobacteria bacterium]MBT6385980.1 DUF3179 domain-containing protein [Alphaproteobacteria bacterium]MBT7747311.1 DUF3179 domain-containing protein [Alphaproteobacteria bacterium]
MTGYLRRLSAVSTLAIAGLFFVLAMASAGPAQWKSEWPKTDFSNTSIDLSEIMSGGPPKDGIPSIDNPLFVPLAEATQYAETEPVIGLSINGDARAYPLQILMWHEIVNDTVGGVPVSITFCPLCNAAIVFDRRLDGRTLEFGTTGKLRRSDLVMYDRQTETWWQQFLGQGIAGELNGKVLKTIPSRLESMALFRQRFENAKVLVPSVDSRRRYGANPYAYYDSMPQPFLYRGPMPVGIAPLARVVSFVDGDGKRQAWSLDRLRRDRRVEAPGNIVITWEAGQNSALDSPTISEGMDVGNVVVQIRKNSGYVDVAYGVDFAFAFNAFYPKIEVKN